MFLAKGKNYIINGTMNFWQRGTSFASQVADNQYVADRFQYQKNGGAVIGHSVLRDTDVPSLAQAGAVFPYSAKLALTTPRDSLGASEGAWLVHKIEGNFIAPFAGKTMTLSFWVKASLPGKYSISFRNGTATKSLVRSYIINNANTWEKKIITFTHDASLAWSYDTGIGLNIAFILACGTTYTASTENSWLDGLWMAATGQVNGVATGAVDFKITGVMLEEGERASGFERAGGSYLRELQLCQRYFEKSYDVDVAPGTITSAGRVYYSGASSGGNGGSFHILFKVSKRVPPSGATYSDTTGVIHRIRTNAADVASQSSEAGHSGMTAAMTAGATWLAMGCQWTADAEL